MTRFLNIAAYAMLAFPLSASAAGAATTQGVKPLPSETAEQATLAFLEAFNALDAARMGSFFAEDATMFFPSGPFPKARVEGKAAVTAAFSRLFEMAKERGTTRLNFQPLDMKVQQFGGSAVATFHLKGNGNIGRRSLLLRADGTNWQIVHFHASALEESN